MGIADRSSLLSFILVALTLMIASPSFAQNEPTVVGCDADTVYVASPTGEKEADRASILAALEEVEPGGTVLFAPETYLIGEAITVAVPKVTLLGHPDGTRLRGCDPSGFGDKDVAVAECNGFSLTGGHQAVRDLTFEYTWHALILGGQACEAGDCPPETLPVDARSGGYVVEQNTFRESQNGIRVVGQWPEPAVIRDNRFVNTYHAVMVNGMTAHVLDNQISVPEAERLPYTRHPGLALMIGGWEAQGAPACDRNIIAGNRIAGHPDAIAILLFPGGACRDNVIRDNTIEMSRVRFESPSTAIHVRSTADSTVAGVPLALLNGVFGDGLIEDNLIEGNRIIGAEGLAIEVLGASGNRIVDNTIVGVVSRDPFPGNTLFPDAPEWGDVNGSGIWISPGSEGNEIAGNTFEDVASFAVVLEGDRNRVATESASDTVRELGDGNKVVGPDEVGGEPLRTEDPETVVMDQVEAFNAGDLEAFLSFYHEDATYHHVAPDTSWTKSGKATLRESFSFLTEIPEGSGVDVVDTLVAGRYVALQERARRAPPGSPGALVLYEVEDGLIRNAWVYYPGPRKRAVAAQEEWPKIEWSSVDRALYTGTYRRSGEVVTVEMDERGWLRVVNEEETLDLVPEGSHVFAFGRYEDGRPTEILHPQVRLEFLVEDGEVTGYEVRPAEGGDAFISAVRIK